MALSNTQLVAIRPYLEAAIQGVDDLCTRIDREEEVKPKRERYFSREENFAVLFGERERVKNPDIERWENEGGAVAFAYIYGDLPDWAIPFNAYWHHWSASSASAADWLQQVELKDEFAGVQIELAKRPATYSSTNDLPKLNATLRAAAEQVRSIFAAVLSSAPSAAEPEAAAGEQLFAAGVGNRGGRPPKWDGLLQLDCKMKADPKVTDKSDKNVVATYNKMYAGPIGKGQRDRATVDALREARRYRDRGSSETHK